MCRQLPDNIPAGIREMQPVLGQGQTLKFGGANSQMKLNITSPRTADLWKWRAGGHGLAEYYWSDAD